MVRKQYHVSNLDTRDRSFIICLGSLLLFLLLVGIIFLMIWGIRTGTKGSEHGEGDALTDELHGNETATEEGGTETTAHTSEAEDEAETTEKEEYDEVAEDTTTSTPEEPTTSTISSAAEETTTPALIAIGEMHPMIPDDNETMGAGLEDPENLTRNENLHLGETGGLTLVAGNATGLETSEICEQKKLVVCETKQCKQKAGVILTMLDHTSRPCEETYPYACGGMQESQVIQPPQPQLQAMLRISSEVNNINNTSPASHQRFKQIYESCLTFPKISEDNEMKIVENLTTRYGEDNIQTTEINADVFTRLVADLILVNTSPLMEVNLEPETFQGESVFVLSLLPPTRDPSWPWLSIEESKRCGISDKFDIKELNTLKREYQSCELSNLSVVSESDKPDFEFMTKSGRSPGDLRTMQALRNFTVLSVDDLGLRYPVVKWANLFSRLTNKTGTTWDYTRVHIYSEEYFRTLAEHIETRGYRQLYNSLRSVLKMKLKSSFQQEKASCLNDRKMLCLQSATQLLKRTASNIYLQSFTTNELTQIFATVTMMSQKIVKSYENLFKTSTYANIDKTSNEILLKKVSSLSIIADGGIEVYQNNSAADKMPMWSSQHFLEMALQCMKMQQRDKYQMWNANAKAQEHIWGHQVNAFDTSIVVILELNAVVVPYGLSSLQNLENIPEYLNFADFGFSLSSAVAKILDETGIKFDHQGQFYEAGLPKFETGASVYKELFDQIRSSHSFTRSHRLGDTYVDYMIFSQAIINEMFADFVGLYLSFAAAAESAKDWLPLPYLNLTTQQTYFVTAIQKLCTKSPARDYFRFNIDGESLPNFIRTLFSKSVECCRTSKATKGQRGFSEAFNCYFTQEEYFFDYLYYLLA